MILLFQQLCRKKTKKNIKKFFELVREDSTMKIHASYSLIFTSFMNVYRCTPKKQTSIQVKTKHFLPANHSDMVSKDKLHEILWLWSARNAHSNIFATGHVSKPQCLNLSIKNARREAQNPSKAWYVLRCAHAQSSQRICFPVGLNDHCQLLRL